MYAVITGASQGLGKSIAEELAKQNNNLILISLPEQNLEQFAHYLIWNYSIEVIYRETDLSIKENVLETAQLINKNYPINILINNAGIGGSKKFDQATSQYIDKILQLNIVATSLLTHQLLANLKNQDKGYILNVSSLAALSPIGYKTVYPASKAFIHSFSRGLSQELKDSNVRVSVVNPGAMATNDEVTKRIEKQGFFGKLTLLNPSTVAKKCIRNMFKGNSLIIVNPFSWILLHLIPIWVRLPLMTKAIKKEVNQ